MTASSSLQSLRMMQESLFPPFSLSGLFVLLVCVRMSKSKCRRHWKKKKRQKKEFFGFLVF